MKFTATFAAALSVFAAEEATACYGRTGHEAQTRFVLRGDEALDTKTGLVWRRCSLGLAWDGRHSCVGRIAAVDLDDALRMAKETGAQWRLPAGPELQSIVDPTCGSPVVDVSVFPDIRRDEEGEADYWTTNPVGVANLFYFFDFMSGRADGHTRGYQLAVRLVRDGK